MVDLFQRGLLHCPDLAKVGYIGKVGDDQWGKIIQQEFVKYGVDISHLTVERGGSSNCSFVLVEVSTGERAFMIFPSDTLPVELSQEEEEYIRNSRMLFLDGSNGQVIIEAAKIAKENDIFIFIDGLAIGKLRELVDIAICGEKMAYRITGSTHPEEALEKLYQEEYRILGITLGPRGSIFKEGKGFTDKPPSKSTLWTRRVLEMSFTAHSPMEYYRAGALKKPLNSPVPSQR